jgi:hypothetical protein
MMQALVALAAGLLFGLGLLISGMSDPIVVLGFLDVAGRWNPSLAFVMVGAIAIAAPAFAYVRRTRRTLGGAPIELPDRTRIDARLVFGSAIFGMGWGLAGLCPGPALVLLGRGLLYAMIFVGAMAAGLVAARFIRWPRAVAPISVRTTGSP